MQLVKRLRKPDIIVHDGWLRRRGDSWNIAFPVRGHCDDVTWLRQDATETAKEENVRADTDSKRVGAMTEALQPIPHHKDAFPPAKKGAS